MESKNSTYEMRVRAVQAVEDGQPVEEIARAYGVVPSTIYRWVQRYEEGGGEKGLVRKPVSGRPRALPEQIGCQIESIVLKPASTFRYETDLWTCGRLHQVICREFGLEVSRWTVWRRLREAGLTYQKPERRYFQADEEERQAWLQQEVPRIRAAIKQYRAILYCEDEANISLTAVLGKTWAPCGETPTQTVTGSRGGVAAMSAISSRGSLVFSLQEKRIVSADVIRFLKQLLQHHKRRHLVVLMDQAPPHTSKLTMNFIEQQPRLHVFHLPAYSPDWNPDEKVWNHLKHQELKSHQARTKAEIKKLARRKLSKMARNPEQLRGIFFRCFVAELLH